MPMPIRTAFRKAASKRVFSYGLKLVITVVILYVILSSLDASRLWTTLNGVDPAFVATALLILGLQTLVASIRWQCVLMPLGARLSFISTYRVLLIGAYFNQGLPSAIGGDAVRILYVQRAGLPLSRAMTSVVLDRLAAMLWMVIATAVTFPALLNLANGGPKAWSVGVLALGGILAFCVLALGHIALRPLRGTRFLRWVTSLSADFWRVFFRSSASLELHFYSILSLVMTVLVIYVLAKGFGANISLLHAMVLIPPVLILIVLPISIAGWGLREAVMVSAFALIGTPGETAVAISVLFGLGVLLWSLPGGIIWLTQRHRIMQAQPAPADAREDNSGTGPFTIERRHSE